MVLPDTFELEAATLQTSGFSSTTIANGATGTGSAIANQTNLDGFLSAEFVWNYPVAPTANKTNEVYLLYAVDATNYEEVTAHSLIGAFNPEADTATHRRSILKNVFLRPFAFKIAVKNVDTGQTITLTVNAYTHNTRISE